jgi:hypothetical protein
MANFKLAGGWKNAVEQFQKDFYNSERALQDAEVAKLNQQLINQGFPVKLNDLVSRRFNEGTGQLEPYFRPRTQEINQPLSVSGLSLEAVNRLRSMLGTNTPVQVTNSYLQNKTPENYFKDIQGQEETNLLPLMRKLGSRVYKLGEQYADNIPGLSSLGEYSTDDSVGTAGALIQAGGRVLPLAGAAWLGINAGPTSAGTLEEARKKGYMR